MKSKLLILTLLTIGLTSNSQAIAQNDVEGEKARCDLRWGINQGTWECRYQAKNGRLILYLEGEGDTQQTVEIDAENLMFFPTAKQYEWNSKLFQREKLISNVDLFYREPPGQQDNNRSNRVAIYLEHGVKDEKKQQQRRQLRSFLNLNQKLNQETQNIIKQMDYLQSIDTSEPSLSQTAAINRLLTTRKCARCDLSNADLSGQDLRDVNLEGANLQNAILTDADLEGAYLLGAKLDNAQLDGALLNFAELPFASLTKANLAAADLSGANLQQVDLRNGVLVGAKLADFTNLKQANLQNVNLSEAEMKGVNLSGANLKMANLNNTKISVGNVAKDAGSIKYFFPVLSDLAETNLSQASLVDAQMQGVILYRANLSNADMLGIDLSPGKVFNREFASNLVEANLTNADLSFAFLNKAYFTKANLTNAQLNDSDLNLAQMAKANLTMTNLINSDLHKAYLVDANLENALLENTRMTNINMTGINLKGVNLNSVDLEDSNLCRATLPNGSISEEDCE